MAGAATEYAATRPAAAPDPLSGLLTVGVLLFAIGLTPPASGELRAAGPVSRPRGASR